MSSYEQSVTARGEIPSEVGGGVGVDAGGHCLEHLNQKTQKYEQWANA